MSEDRLREYEESLKRLGELKIGDLRELWIEYDKQTDTLYINFGREEPDESIMVEDDVIVNIKGDKVVGIVVMEFSRRAGL
ncbi:MAG: DUF2283 domain-containing protein [Desulfurococcales archaeon]|nr:DUF2283 domain-containing protein [Desulfurococcales archaeon]